jgi:hypothetical protein
MAAVLMFCALPASAQAPQGQRGAMAPQGERGAGAPGAQAGAGRGTRTPAPEPIADFADSEGFVSIFDGTMEGWNCDEKFWRAEGGEIIGQSTPDVVVEQNTFCIWDDGQPGDFELKLEFRMDSTNSGVQYRSELREDQHPWRLVGYQADFDFGNRFTGQLYEEGGRGFLARRGQVVRAAPDRQLKIIGTMGTEEELGEFVDMNGWNEFHIIAKGNVQMHIVNEHPMAIFVDDDPENRRMSGYIGFQIHRGDPMTVEFRNIRLKSLD